MPAGWMPILREMKQCRDDAREEARRSKNENDWRSYRTKRNIYNKELIRTKNLYFKEQYEQFEKEKDVKNIYNQTKKLLKIKTAGPPSTFLKNGTLIKKKQLNWQPSNWNISLKRLIN